MSDSTTQIKSCNRCKIEYPHTDEHFYRIRGRLAGMCKTCRNQYWLEYYHRKMKSDPVFRDKRQGYNESLYANEERMQRRRNTENKRERKKYAENPEPTRSKNRNYRARELAAEGTHTADDIEAQHKRQKGKCYYCGCKMTKTVYKQNSATVDRVVPLDRGGRNSPDNLVIACWKCNSSKRNKLPHEWAKGMRLL